MSLVLIRSRLSLKPLVSRCARSTPHTHYNWPIRSQPTEFRRLASGWSILTIAKPVRPAVGWGVPRAHRDSQGWRLSLNMEVIVTVMIIWLYFTVLLKGFFKMCMPFSPWWPLPLFHSCNLYVWVNSVLYKAKLDVGHFQSLEVSWWKISFDLWNKLKIVLSWYRYASILIHKVSLFNCGIIKHDVLKGGSKIFHSGLTTENSLVLLSVHNLFPEGLEKWPSCLCSLICEHQVNASTRLAWKHCRSE